MARASILVHKEWARWYRLITPYHKAFLDEFRAAIPGSLRRWDPDAKEWYFKDTELNTVVEVVSKYFDQIDTDVKFDDSEGEASSSSNGKSQWEILCLTSEAPIELVKFAYKMFAKVRHPDHGGSTKAMAELNRAYSDAVSEIEEREAETK